MAHANTILVIDDEAPMRLSFNSILKEHFTVKAFEKGSEAIQYVKENPGEAYAAFVDYTMPDMNGDEVCNALRAADNEISLIGFSGSDAAVFTGPIYAQLHKKFFSVQKVYEVAVSAVNSAIEIKKTRR